MGSSMPKVYFRHNYNTILNKSSNYINKKYNEGVRFIFVRPKKNDRTVTVYNIRKGIYHIIPIGKWRMTKDIHGKDTIKIDKEYHEKYLN